MAFNIQEEFGLNEDEVDLIKNTVARGSTDHQLYMFLLWCKRKHLDPLMKQAYFSLRKTKCVHCYAKQPEVNTCKHCDRGFNLSTTFIEAIDGLIARAKDFGDFQGVHGHVVCINDDFEFDAIEDKPVKHRFLAIRGAVIGAWAQIKFKDGKPPVSYWYPLSEYKDSAGTVAAEKVGLMLLKSAMSTLIRRTYPEPEIAGGSYVPEEFGKEPQIAEADVSQPHPDIEVEVNQATPFDEVAAQLAETHPGVVATPVVNAAIEDGAQVVEVGEISHPPIAPGHVFKQADGVLDYKYEHQSGDVYVKLVHVAGDMWKPHNEACVTISPNTVKNVQALFVNNFEMQGSMMKHFKKATIKALTWEELAALIQAKKYNNPDPRWYGDKKPALKQYTAEQVMDLVDFYQFKADQTGDKEFIDNVLKLKEPGCLMYLLTTNYGWSWEHNRRDFHSLAKMLAEGVIEYDTPEYLQVVNDVTVGSSQPQIA